MPEVLDRPVERSLTGPSRVHERALLRRYQASRSPALREEMVRCFMPLARSLAMRYRGGREPIEDLVQVANIGLVNAVDRFDSRVGASFAAFAVPTIRGELRRHFRDRVWQLRLPRALQELTMRIDGAVDELNGELGRPPTPSEIAVRLGIGSEQVLRGMAASHARRTLSIDAPAPADADATPVIAMIGVAEPGYDRVETQLACAGAGLDDRERLVLRLLLVDRLTQSEIGGKLGVSQMQISRINRRAMLKLLAAVQADQAVDTTSRSCSR